MDEIISDVEKRGLKVAALVCENEEGKLQLLSYESNGLVKFISEPVCRMDVNERLDGRMVRPIAEIGKSN